MSFFEQGQHDLAQERSRRSLEGGFHESEDIAVYTWGEESYDGLGDALQEEDDLNDETFGETGDVGKDFDFSNPTLPSIDHPPANAPTPKGQTLRSDLLASPPKPSLPTARAAQSLEAIWDDKSPISVLSRADSMGRHAGQQWGATPSSFSPSTGGSPSTIAPPPISHGITQTGVRTLQEIESEMRAAAQAAKRQHELELQQQEFEAQQQHLQLQQLQKQQLQQQQLHMHERTPPPRMLPTSQSPRFHDRQRQMLLLQQQEQQLRSEESERSYRTQQGSQRGQLSSHINHQPQLSRPTLAEMLNHQRLQHSPAFVDLTSQQSMSQQLLSELSQMDISQNAAASDNGALRMEAMRKIMEAERMEGKRRRKAAKIAHMARYNDLMTQSDKDFITRIQVSQLVTQDPYADDFYAQVYGAIMRSRMGLQSQDERVLKFGSGGGVGLGIPPKGGGRRPNAMQRMEAQVERIVSNARLREKEKGLHSLHSLQGALGKTSGRSYKAAPRQLLQVDAESVHATGASAAKEAAKLGREALGSAAHTDGLVRQEPLSPRQILAIIENLYDLVLNVEQLRRDQPPMEDEEAYHEWEDAHAQLVSQIWDGLRVMVPLETSNPHPFISLLSPTKGKKILPRLSRHLSSQQMLTMLTLLVACFGQLDVVIHAPILDSLKDTPERGEVDHQTQMFLGSVLQSILPVVAKAGLRLISGLLGLLLDRSNISRIAQTKPGLALLTLFLSRVELIKQAMTTATDISELPSPEETQQWQTMFDHLFQLLAPYLTLLFPSTRLTSILPSGSDQTPFDVVDQPVWQFLAALALHASAEQQQVLVAKLREKVMENIADANRSQGADGDESWTRLSNVNLFLNALGLQFNGNQFIFKSCEFLVALLEGIRLMVVLCGPFRGIRYILT